MSTKKSKKHKKKKSSSHNKSKKDSKELVKDDLLNKTIKKEKKRTKSKHKKKSNDFDKNVEKEADLIEKPKRDERVSPDNEKYNHHHYHNHYHYYKSKSRERLLVNDDHQLTHKRKKKRSKSRSKSRSRVKKNRKSKSRSRSRTPINYNKNDTKLKFDKKKLLEIAKMNAIKATLKNEYLVNTQININNNQTTIFSNNNQINSTKTVEDLIDYCKKLTQTLNENDQVDHHHPFEMKEIDDTRYDYLESVNIPNKKVNEPVKEPIHQQFPVSSGTEHRIKEVKPIDESSNTLAAASSDVPLISVNETNTNPSIIDEDIQISELVTQRIESMKRISQNPNDFEAYKMLEEANTMLHEWATSKQIPGQFTGSTGAKFLAPHELEGQFIAWARKDFMSKATPITDGIGKRLLEKMGWKQGEGLGKKKEGPTAPLALDIKTDRKGLVSHEEINQGKKVDLTAQPGNKHPVSALMEYCKLKHWNQPEFVVVSEFGPPHLRSFLMKVTVNNVDYQPTTSSLNKKTAKANAAIVCLQSLGLLPT